MAKPVGYLPTLDGWRAFAVLAVIFSHFAYSASVIKQMPHWVYWVLTGSGVKGVQLFFAISGFLITSRLIEESNCSGRISLKRFYVRRVCRILPPATTYLLIVAFLGLAGVLPFSLKYWLSALCFFRNYMPAGGTVIDVHYWTLSVEEQFYLIWPALLVLFGLYRARYTASILILGIWVWRLIAFHHIGGATLGQGEWERAEVCFDGLLLGCLFALALESPKLTKWLAKYLTVGAVAVIVVIILVTGGRTYTPSGRSIQSMLMPFLIVATMLNPHTWLGRLLEFSVLRWIGRLSYSLYIWQQLFTFERFLPWSSMQLLALFGVAALSFYFIEKPMIRLGYRLAPPPSLGHKDLGVKAIDA
ncbi:MAG: acyltransferase [Acidobacteriota bacterium]|nr:acyltransferase [Acidobacteriota bacterium]